MKDNFYVVKVIAVENQPESVQIEALAEIQLMASLDSPYVVGYLDSFIDEAQINIVLEYCPMGDLNLVIANRKKNNPFNDNIIWKIFINLCLGL